MAHVEVDERIGYKVPGVALNNVVLTEEKVVRCERCLLRHDCQTRTSLRDPFRGFCSDGRTGV